MEDGAGNLTPKYCASAPPCNFWNNHLPPEVESPQWEFAKQTSDEEWRRRCSRARKTAFHIILKTVCVVKHLVTITTALNERTQALSCNARCAEAKTPLHQALCSSVCCDGAFFLDVTSLKCGKSATWMDCGKIRMVLPHNMLQPHTALEMRYGGACSAAHSSVRGCLLFVGDGVHQWVESTRKRSSSLTKTLLFVTPMEMSTQPLLINTRGSISAELHISSMPQPADHGIHQMGLDSTTAVSDEVNTLRTTCIWPATVLAHDVRPGRARHNTNQSCIAHVDVRGRRGTTVRCLRFSTNFVALLNT